MGVTIKDIAKAAGVSFSTVSKALRDSPLVKEPTKKRITDIAMELGYQPNAAARSLVSKKSHTIGIIWPTIEGTAHSSLITRLNTQLEQLSYTTLISINEKEFAINLFNRYQVDAILCFDDNPERQTDTSSAVPVVSYGIADKGSSSPVVDVQRKKAVYMATNYLSSIGHRFISYIGALNNPIQDEKAKGFKLAAEGLGLPCFTHQIVEVQKLDPYDGYIAAKEVLESGERPTAIISGSHDLSKGILRAAGECGIKVPDDLSIISYDNLPDDSDTPIPLSTVGVPMDHITLRLTDVLMDVINEDDIEKVLFLEPELKVTDSCRPPSNH